MFRTALRAVVFIFLGFAVAAPAYANGQVENAMQLWMSSLRTAYDAVIASTTARNYVQARIDATALKTLTKQMQDATYLIQQTANGVAPELAAAWTDTMRAMDSFNTAAGALEQQIGKETPTIDPLRSSFAAADDAVHKSWDFTKNFGREYGELMSGPVESAKQLNDGYLSNGVKTMADLLISGNTVKGAEEAGRLMEIVVHLVTFSGAARDGAADLARPLTDFWEPTNTAAEALQDSLDELTPKIGVTEYASDLATLQSSYADVNAAIVRSYKDIMDFGARLRVVCDDWR